MILIAATLLGSMVNADVSNSFEQQRTVLLNRKREVIYNTDGCDALYFPNELAATRDNFISRRLINIRGSRVDTLSYCPQSAGFGNFTAKTKSADILLASVPLIKAGTHNITAELISQGTDPLRLAREYAKTEGIEFFLSIRVNDTHDSSGTLEKPHPLLPEFKKRHPEFLFAAPPPAPKPPYCSWSAVDFSHTEVRERMKNFVRELTETYDIDGIEYDFMRHMQLFRSVAFGAKASASELAQMADFMIELRAITEEIGRRRGRPVLVAIRVPDSIPYCRGVGIDLEDWLGKRVADILITSSYFQLNPWEESARIATKYGVKFYPSLDESRIRNDAFGLRNSDPAYFARALDALRAGADGIYYFNLEDARRTADTMRGNRADLEFEDKLYFATVRGSGGFQPGFYLANGAKYKNLPSIDPKTPIPLIAGKSYNFPLWIGDDPAQAQTAGKLPQAEVRIQVSEPDEAAAYRLTINGKEYQGSGRENSIIRFSIDSRVLHPGRNELAIHRESTIGKPAKLLDFVLELTYPKTSI